MMDINNKETYVFYFHFIEHAFTSIWLSKPLSRDLFGSIKTKMMGHPL